MSDCQIFRFLECQIFRFSDWHIVDCQFSKLSYCQNVIFSNVWLPDCWCTDQGRSRALAQNCGTHSYVKWVFLFIHSINRASETTWSWRKPLGTTAAPFPNLDRFDKFSESKKTSFIAFPKSAMEMMKVSCWVPVPELVLNFPVATCCHLSVIIQTQIDCHCFYIPTHLPLLILTLVC